MKTFFKILFIATLLIYASRSFAQETVSKGDAIIHAQILGPDFNQKILIDVYTRGDHAKINYARFDSIAYTKARHDTAYANASKNMNYLDQKQVAKVEKIFERYTVYDTTTAIINLQKDTAYRQILRLISQTTKNELELSKVGKRITLDGFGFSCTIITDTEIKKIAVGTPTSASHPIIANFLKETTGRVFEKR